MLDAMLVASDFSSPDGKNAADEAGTLIVEGVVMGKEDE